MLVPPPPPPRCLLAKLSPLCSRRKREPSRRAATALEGSFTQSQRLSDTKRFRSGTLMPQEDGVYAFQSYAKYHKLFLEKGGIRQRIFVASNVMEVT